MLDFILSVLGWSLVLAGAVLVGYYIFLELVKANIFWTRVESGWCKIVLEWGEYSRTLYPGLRWIGIPGVNTLYKRTMTFMKSAVDKDGKAQAEPHDDKDISSFKTTQYPYALPFQNEEDSHGLPLSGIVAVFARMVDYRKAFFNVSDWYSEMNTRILACLRRVIAEVPYDDDIVGRDLAAERTPPTFSERLWQALNATNGGPSIVGQLREVCGIEVESVELRSVDPPADWRATTLAPYKAQREEAAAVHQAKASAVLFDDTNQALKTWLESQRAAGLNPTRAQIDAKQRELRERALAKTPGYQQVDIRGLENASTAVVGGGGAGIMVGGGGGQRKPGKKGSGAGGPQDGQPAKSAAEKAQDFADANGGEYPRWDPEKRKPQYNG